MKNHVKAVLDHADVPMDLKELDDRLNTLQQSLLAIRDRVPGKEMTPAMAHDFDALNALAHFCEVARGGVQALSEHESRPQKDPLTMMDVAEKYRAIRPQEAQAVRDEFMAKARAITGTHLRPEQIRALFALLHHFDPIPPGLRHDDGPR